MHWRVARNYHPLFLLSIYMYIFIFNEISLFLYYFIIFLILTCSCQYSNNLMLTATCMFRSYILLSTRQETPKLLKSYTCSLRLHLMHLISIISFKLGHVSIPKRRSFSPLCLFCAYDSSVLHNFKISTNLLLHFSYSTLRLTK
jgi:hypothetical protein